MAVEIIDGRKVVRNIEHALGACPECGETDGVLNPLNSDWLVCSAHKTRWDIGVTFDRSLRGRDVDEEVRRNVKTLFSYREVEPLMMMSPLEGAVTVEEVGRARRLCRWQAIPLEYAAAIARMMRLSNLLPDVADPDNPQVVERMLLAELDCRIEELAEENVEHSYWCEFVRRHARAEVLGRRDEHADDLTIGEAEKALETAARLLEDARRARTALPGPT